MAVGEHGVLVVGAAQAPVGLEVTDRVRPLALPVERQPEQLAHRRDPGRLVGEGAQQADHLRVALPLEGAGRVAQPPFRGRRPSLTDRGSQVLGHLPRRTRAGAPAPRCTACVACRRTGAASWRHSSGSHAGGGPGSGGRRRVPPRGRAPFGVGWGVTSCAPWRATEPQPLRGGGAAASVPRLRRGAGFRGGGAGLMAWERSQGRTRRSPRRGGFVDWRNPAATYSPRGPPPKYHRRWRA